MRPESAIQCSVIEWWSWASKGYKLDSRLLSHCPNGGKRSKVEASIFKGMGVRAGMEDLFLAVPCFGVSGLFLELKTKDGTISSDQREMMDIHQHQGYAVCVAWSVEEGVSAIINYLKTGDPLRKS